MSWTHWQVQYDAKEASKRYLAFSQRQLAVGIVGRRVLWIVVIQCKKVAHLALVHVLKTESIRKNVPGNHKA